MLSNEHNISGIFWPGTISNINLWTLAREDSRPNKVEEIELDTPRPTPYASGVPQESFEWQPRRTNESVAGQKPYESGSSMTNWRLIPGTHSSLQRETD